MHILWNFQQNLRWSSWKIAESFLKTKWPHYAVNNYIYYTKHESSVADKDNSIWAALSNDGNYTAVITYPMHMPLITWPWKWSSKRKSVFPILDGYNVTSVHDKANLITYLYTKRGLLL